MPFQAVNNSVIFYRCYIMLDLVVCAIVGNDNM